LGLTDEDVAFIESEIEGAAPEDVIDFYDIY
jgi:hypothetical protein